MHVAKEPRKLGVSMLSAAAHTAMAASECSLEGHESITTARLPRRDCDLTGPYDVYLTSVNDQANTLPTMQMRAHATAIHIDMGSSWMCVCNALPL